MAPRSPFVKTFLPFGALIIGGYVGLAQFRKVKYENRPDQRLVVYKEQLEKAGMGTDDYQARLAESSQAAKLSSEAEYEKVVAKLNLDKWENKRGPRPWEKKEEMEERLKREAEERAKQKKA